MSALTMKGQFDHNVRNNEVISIGLRRYQMGSCASYSLEYNECPIRSVERAKKHGHNIWWANQMASCISSRGERPDYGTPVEYGQVLYFEGHLFRIEKASNDNIHLVEIEGK